MKQLHVDELRAMSITEIAVIAVTLDDPDYFWWVTGILTAKLPSNHPAVAKLWDAGHSKPENYLEARRICLALIEAKE